MADRTVHTRWHGGMRAVTEAGGFDIVVDEPKSSGGTNTGPQPTDLLLASITSCFALAIAYAAHQRGVELAGLIVEAAGTYDGPKFVRIAVTVASNSPRTVLEELMPQAERLCYVTNTLRYGPEVTIALG
jgi:putative redox protein